MFGGRSLFFFDKLVDEPGYAATAKTAGQFQLCFTLGVAHEALVEGLFGADIVIVVEGQLAALATLQIFRHVVLVIPRVLIFRSLRRVALYDPSIRMAGVVEITSSRVIIADPRAEFFLRILTNIEEVNNDATALARRNDVRGVDYLAINARVNSVNREFRKVGYFVARTIKAF